MKLSSTIKIWALTIVVMLTGCASDPYPLSGAILNTEFEVTWHAKTPYNEPRRLIEKGADVNVHDEHGRTPLMWAAVLGDSSLLDISYNAEQRRAIHTAATEIAKLLIAKGADVNAIDPTNEFTALHYAASSGNRELAKLLIKNGAKVNAKAQGAPYTPLFQAITSGETETANLLIANGADVSVRKLARKVAKDHLPWQAQRKAEIKAGIREEEEAQAAAALEKKRRDKESSKEMWGAIGTIAVGAATGMATRDLEPEQQSRMMESSMRAVQSGDSSEFDQTANQIKAERAQAQKEKVSKANTSKVDQTANKKTTSKYPWASKCPPRSTPHPYDNGTPGCWCRNYDEVQDKAWPADENKTEKEALKLCGPYYVPAGGN